MSKPTKYPYLAVIGRVPGDDEDSIYLFENKTLTQASKAFEMHLYDDCPEETPTQVRKDWGESCYITQILVSDAEIEIIGFNR